MNQAKPTKNSKEKGATMLEYGVMVALILVASVAAVRGIGFKIADSFTEIDTELALGDIQPPGG